MITTRDFSVTSVANLVRAELRIEFRSPTGLISAILFSFLALLTQALALPERAAGQPAAAAAVFFVSSCFAGLLAETARIARERKSGVPFLYALTPTPGAVFFAGKSFAVFSVLCLIQIFLVPFLIVFFGLPANSRWLGAGLLALESNIALACLLALFGAATGGWKGSAQTLALPILILPLALPVLATAAVGCGHVLADARPIGPYLKLLLAADLSFALAGALLYPKLLGRA